MKGKVLILYTNPFNGQLIVEWVKYDEWNLIEQITETKLLSPKIKKTER